MGSRSWASSLPLPRRYIPTRAPSGTGPFQPEAANLGGPREPDFPPNPAASSSRAILAEQMGFGAGPQPATYREEMDIKGGKRALGQPLSVFIPGDPRMGAEPGKGQQ